MSTPQLIQVRIAVLVSLAMVTSVSQAEGLKTAPNLQYFNEKILGPTGTKAVPVLLPAPEGAWSPISVALDYDNTLCYGAIVKYSNTHDFEALRAAINSRFKRWERPFFENDPQMGIWRHEHEGFAIQMTKADGDTHQLIYIRYTEDIVEKRALEVLQDPEILELFTRPDEPLHGDPGPPGR